MGLGWPHWLVALSLAIMLHIQAVQWWSETAVVSVNQGGQRIELNLALAVSESVQNETSASAPEMVLPPATFVSNSAQPSAVQPSAAAAGQTQVQKRAKPKTKPVARASVKAAQKKPVSQTQTQNKPKPEVKPVAKPVAKPAAKAQKAPASQAARSAQSAKAQAKPEPSSSTESFKGSATQQPVDSQSVASVDPKTIQRDYMAQLSVWINRHKRYPRQAQRRGQEGTVKLRFAMNRSGQLLSSEVLGSSGYPVLDQAALAMLKRAAPLPPIPGELARQRLEVILPIAFDLR